MGAAVAVLVLAGCARPAGGDASPSVSSSRSSASSTVPSASSAPSVPSSQPSTAPSAPAADAPLRGTTWYFVARINNDLRIDQPADPDAWIRFDADSLTFNGTVERSAGDFDLPCATWKARVTVEPDEVRLLKSKLDDDESRSGCGTRFLSYGTETASLDLQGRTLSVHLDEGPNQSTLLFSADAPTPPTVSTLDLSFMPAPSARTVREVLDTNPLRGRNFRADSITGRTIEGKGVTIRFGVDAVGLNAGCNGGGAGYAVDGDTMTFSQGSWTLMACMEKGIMQQESWLQEFASGSARFSLEDSRLTITKGKTEVVLSETSSTPGGSDRPSSTSVMLARIDEIVDSAGHHPLPKLEPGQFWSQDPNLVLSGKRLVFDVGCGQYIADFSGSFPSITLPVADGTILHDCPPNRSALAAALRLILSGPVTIDRDGAFITFTGRDGLQVTAHSGYQNG